MIRREQAGEGTRARGTAVLLRVSIVTSPVGLVAGVAVTIGLLFY